jgi:hypothetical protein
MLIAAAAVALVRIDLDAMTSLYHANLAKVQLLLEFSGSDTPVAVAALVR